MPSRKPESTGTGLARRLRDYWPHREVGLRIIPAQPLGADLALFSTGNRHPCKFGGPASALRLSRPARRSLRVTASILANSVESPSTSEASAASLPPRLLRSLPAVTRGAGFAPAEDGAFAQRINLCTSRLPEAVSWQSEGPEPTFSHPSILSAMCDRP